MKAARFATTFGLTLALAASAAARPLPEGAPLATIDLATRAGAALVKASWHYADARVVETMHRAPDAEGQPTGAPIATQTIEPRAGRADFDDSAWATIAPESLVARRGGGRIAFNWYRTTLTVPEKIGGVPTARRDTRFSDHGRRLRRDLGRRRDRTRDRPERRIRDRRLERAESRRVSARREARAEDPDRGVRSQRSALRPACELHLGARGARSTSIRGRHEPARSRRGSERRGRAARSRASIAIVPPNAKI